jgi:hypothetical protein
MVSGWPVCVCPGCGGSGVYGADGDTCLAHLTEDELAVARKRCRSEPLDARGVTFTPALLSRVLTDQRVLGHGGRFDGARFEGLAGFGRAVFAGPVVFTAARFAGDAGFDRASFECGASFEEATFERVAGYRGATFRGPARFTGARFAGYGLFEAATFGESAGFELAKFGGVANFERAAFEGSAGFDLATFDGYAGFGRTTFSDRTAFDGATFNGVAWFGEARFEGDAVFQGAAFNGQAGFGGVVFDRRADFASATFGRDAVFSAARFERAAHFAEATFKHASAFDRAAFKEQAILEAATFDGAATLGPIDVGEAVVLDLAVCRAPAVVDVTAARVSCRGTRFAEGVELSVSRAEVALDDARFGRRSTVTAAGDGALNPRLVSIRRAHVANLAVANLDLSPCLFAGADGLDRLRIDGVPRLAPTPSGWRREGWLPWKWTRRLAIAEEHRWRARQRRRRKGWNPARCQSEWLTDSGSLGDIGAGEVAAVYRALRTGLGDGGEPRAADDFYYGEMEMRRKDPGRSPGERIVLWLYWVSSGYGRRRRRALGALLGVVVVVRLSSIFRFRCNARA